MRWTIAPLVIAVIFAAFVGRSLGGQAEIDRAKREMEDARRVYADADNRARWADQNVDRIRIEMDNARARQRELPRQIDADKRELDTLKDQIADAQKTLDQMQKDAADARKLADDRKGSLKDLQVAVASATAAAEDVRKDETARFEATDDFRKEQTQLDLLQSQHDAAAAKCLEKLSGTPAYLTAVAEADAAEAVVKKIRDAGRVDELPAASQKWMQAKSRVELLKSEAMQADPATSDAKAALLKQQAAVRALRNKFEEQLKVMPQMVEAGQKVTATQAALAAANTEIRKLDADATALNRQIIQKKNLVTNGNRMLASGADQLRRREQELRQVDADLARLDRELRDANFQADRARADRANAAQRVRNAEDAYRRAGGQ